MGMNNEIAAGRSAASPEAVNVYDAHAGKYADHMPSIATEAKLPTAQLPMAPAPAPFVIKSVSGGER